VSGDVLGAARLRARATWRARRGTYLALVLLVGLVGGLAMGAVAAARRTQSAFTTFLASTDPSNVTVSVFGGPTNGGGTVSLRPSVVERVARLRGVRHVGVAVIPGIVPLGTDGSPVLDDATLVSVLPIMSENGMLFHQDRLAVVAGRAADPRRADEMEMTATAARVLGVHVGERLAFGAYTLGQEYGAPGVRPSVAFHATVVGLVQFGNAVVQDDIDRTPTFEVFTQALERRLFDRPDPAGLQALTYGIQLVRGDAGVNAFEAAFARIVPPGTSYAFHAVAPVTTKVDRTVEPISIALAVFGGVAALAVLLVAAQILARQVHAEAEDQEVLRALGASPAMVGADAVGAMVVALAAGTALALAVAVALSPLAPLGPVRTVFPGPFLGADWVVLGAGAGVLLGGLGALSVVLAWRAGARRAQRAPGALPTVTARAVGAAAASLPVPAVLGARMALESGRGRTAVPVRSALLGAVLTVALVSASLTFGAGLQSLVSHPALYGWNWTSMLNASNDVPPQALAALGRDRDVAAWTGYDYNDVEIDGQEVPVLIVQDHPAVTPPMLSGHPARTGRQIVLGPATMAQLHTHVGATVTLVYGSRADAPVYIPPVRLTVVGTATMPAVGFASVVSDHTSMGTGGLVTVGVEPPAFQQAVLDPDPTLDGPDLVFVRLRPGVGRAAGLAGLRRIAAVANRALAALPDGAGAGYTVTVTGVQRPAEIVNYGSMGATPALLAASLALGAVVALGLTLQTSVRRRRHDLALLKTLGLTQGQLAWAVAWQATVSAVVGVVVGLPLGIALGRWLWTLFARLIDAVPQPSVPVAAMVVVGVGAVILANVVAAVPGRTAARTPTALLLRTD